MLLSPDCCESLLRLRLLRTAAGAAPNRRRGHEAARRAKRDDELEEGLDDEEHDEEHDEHDDARERTPEPLSICASLSALELSLISPFALLSLAAPDLRTMRRR